MQFECRASVDIQEHFTRVGYSDEMSNITAGSLYANIVHAYADKLHSRDCIAIKSSSRYGRRCGIKYLLGLFGEWWYRRLPGARGECAV